MYPPTYITLCFVLVFCDYTESKDRSKTKGRRGAKNSATAAKVALMKLKLHAVGDKGLPQVHSSYYVVCLTKCPYMEIIKP